MASDVNTTQLNDFVFPAWVNKAVVLGLLAAGLGGGYLATVGFFATHPKVINVGHQPDQPIPFSHALHAGKLKLDCRYCHNTVEKAAHAAIPPSATCGNCHGGKDRVKEGASLAAVHLKSEKLQPLRDSLESDKPIEWLRVHEVPGFVYFNHSAHVTRGVSCVECHGRIDKMEVVYQAKPLSMKWCLDCHRNHEEVIRPFDQVTNLAWNPSDAELGRIYMDEFDKSLKHVLGKVEKYSESDGSVEDLHYTQKKDAKKGHGADDAEHHHGVAKAPRKDPVKIQDDFIEAVFGDPLDVDSNKDGKISHEEAVGFLKENRSAPTRKDLGKLISAAHKIKPNQSCSTCHR